MERYLVEKKTRAAPASPKRSEQLRRCSRHPSFIAIVDIERVPQRAGSTPLAVAAACLAGGARAAAASRQGRRRAPRSCALADRSWRGARARRRALVIVNDRADIARLAGADGVHVGQDDLSVAEVAARSSAPTRSSGCRRTRARRSTRRSRPTRATSPSGRSSAPRTKDTGYAARGLDLVALRRGPRQAGRRDRRHHARARRRSVDRGRRRRRSR